MQNIFWISTGWVVITFIIGLMIATPYSAENFQRVASIQRKLCLSYVIGFSGISYGGTIILGGEWWAWAIIIISSIFSHKILQV